MAAKNREKGGLVRARAEKIREKKVVQYNVSTSSDRVYETVAWSDGTVSCNCKGWIFSGRYRGCAYTRKMISELEVTLTEIFIDLHSTRKAA